MNNDFLELVYEESKGWIIRQTFQESSNFMEKLQ